MGEVKQWLQTLKLNRYAKKLDELGYDDLDQIMSLSKDEIEEMIVEIGIKKKHAKKIRKVILRKPKDNMVIHPSIQIPPKTGHLTMKAKFMGESLYLHLAKDTGTIKYETCTEKKEIHSRDCQIKEGKSDNNKFHIIYEGEQYEIEAKNPNQKVDWLENLKEAAKLKEKDDGHYQALRQMFDRTKKTSLPPKLTTATTTTTTTALSSTTSLISSTSSTTIETKAKAKTIKETTLTSPPPKLTTTTTTTTLASTISTTSLISSTTRETKAKTIKETTLKRKRQFIDVLTTLLDESSGQEGVIASDIKIMNKKRKITKSKIEKKKSKKNSKKKRTPKRLLQRINLIKPQFNYHEKRLVRIATRGVVALFNAVSKHKKSTQEQEKLTTNVNKSIEKEDDSNFFQLLKKPNQTITIITANSNTKRQSEDGKTSKGSSKSTPAWNALQDNYLLNSKLDDWDTEDSENSD